MTLLYIILTIVILLIILVLIIPLKVKVDISIKNTKNTTEEDLNTKNKIEIYILKFIKIKTIDVKQKDKIGENEYNQNIKLKEEKNVLSDISKIASNFINYEKRNSLLISKDEIIKLKESMTFEEFFLIFGFNLKDPIINAYVISILNSIINIYISKNVDKFTLENTAYKTYISNKIIDLRFYSIINFKLVNTIIIILKIIIKLRKVVNKNGKTTSN